jgi:hypothetical protein
MLRFRPKPTESCSIADLAGRVITDALRLIGSRCTWSRLGSTARSGETRYRLEGEIEHFARSWIPGIAHGRRRPGPDAPTDTPAEM